MLKKILAASMLIGLIGCSEPAKEEVATPIKAEAVSVQTENSATEIVAPKKMTKPAPRPIMPTLAETKTANYAEGDYYSVIDLPVSTKPTVTEYFSFYCPHCNTFEPLMESIAQQLPSDARFLKNHVSFMGGNMGRSMSKAYVAMNLLNAEHVMVPVMFNRIHNLEKAPKNDAQLRQMFLDEGVSAKEFDAAYNGFTTDSMVNNFDNSFKKSGLSGVPAVIVNNKFLIKTDKIKSEEEYLDLINFLLKKQG